MNATPTVVIVADVVEAVLLTHRIARQSVRPSDVLGYGDALPAEATDADIDSALLTLDTAAARR